MLQTILVEFYLLLLYLHFKTFEVLWQVELSCFGIPRGILALSLRAGDAEMLTLPPQNFGVTMP